MVIRQNDLRLINWKQLMYLFGILEIAVCSRKHWRAQIWCRIVCRDTCTASVSGSQENTSGEGAERAPGALREGETWEVVRGFVGRSQQGVLESSLSCGLMWRDMWGKEGGKCWDRKMFLICAVLYSYWVFCLTWAVLSWWASVRCSSVGQEGDVARYSSKIITAHALGRTTVPRRCVWKGSTVGCSLCLLPDQCKFLRYQNEDSQQTKTWNLFPVSPQVVRINPFSHNVLFVIIWRFWWGGSNKRNSRHGIVRVELPSSLPSAYLSIPIPPLDVFLPWGFSVLIRCGRKCVI